jgi:hypothetical protein
MKFGLPRAAVLALLALTLAIAQPAAAATTWAPAGTATIHPGVPLLIGDVLCTSNFVFEDPAGDVYLGVAAHCVGSEIAGFDGCKNESLPLGTPVEIGGASRPGRLVYSSWQAMQQRNEADIFSCSFNDFALVQLHRDDRSRVNPSMPHWGGPSGIAAGSTRGDAAFGYGAGYTEHGLSPSPKAGVSFGPRAAGWTHVLDLSPLAVEGDSGSGVMDSQGRAYGVMSTLSLRRGINGAGDLSRSLDYARGSGFPQLNLVPGTEPFSPTGPTPPNPIEALLRALLGG